MVQIVTKTFQVLTIFRPDDWHIHLRDGELLKAVLPYVSKEFGRAIVMPNLASPITTINAAIDYRKKIINLLPENHNFTPLMTCYLTDLTDLNEIENGFNEKVFIAAKLYPVNSTTNSSFGVKNINNIMPVLERMEKLGMPLLVHGEVANTEIDIFDREARFIEEVMDPLRKKLQELKIVFEHITTKEAAEYVRDSNKFLAATITPHHLMFNRNDMLVNNMRPHLYCMPILKRSLHQKALHKLVSSGFNRVFIGTDSAPHAAKRHKESICIYPGCFNSPIAIASYATVFEEINALEHFEAFCSINGPRFYGMNVNNDTIKLVRKETKINKFINLSNDKLMTCLINKTLKWIVKH